ncbi:copper amine oxidase N-terminal domain-containing protein [Paenibacillus silvisoli]|uniref:copper amine oxidase N-terminal domain-containing protein n=1 Tax=Paenibacillus silvisoli TaxID=3110539 RepID=UPI0028049DC5|nr:copper amine oxidase N-terminal domain-containing protein [Paenibacillus silvisoli]
MKSKVLTAAVAASVIVGALFAPVGTERTNAAASSQTIRIEVMGKALQPDTAPIMDHGRVLVPLRAVSEAFGANVQWDGKTNTATVRKWGVSVRLKAASSMVVVEREQPGGTAKATERLDVPMKLHGNRAYVPIRYVAAQFGYKTDWQDKARTVSIGSYLGKQKHDTLYNGDLAEAREIAFSQSYNPQYNVTPMYAHSVGEIDGVTALFPEGEVMRFIRIDGDLAQQIKIVDDQAVVIWAGRLSGTNEERLRNFMQREWTDSVGDAPKPTGDYMFVNSGIFGETGWAEYGVVDAKGAFTQTGYMHYGFGEVDTETGTLEIVKEGEKRSDAAGTL